MYFCRQRKNHFLAKSMSSMSLAAVAVRQMRKRKQQQLQQQQQQQLNNTDKTLESPDSIDKENLEVILH